MNKWRRKIQGQLLPVSQLGFTWKTAVETLYTLGYYVVNYRLRMVEDDVPSKHVSEMEERRQELIGESF